MTKLQRKALTFDIISRSEANGYGSEHALTRCGEPLWIEHRKAKEGRKETNDKNDVVTRPSPRGEKVAKSHL